MLLEASGYLPAFVLGRAPALPWWRFFQWGVTQLYIWWAFTPLVALLVRRFPFEGGRPARTFAAYAAAGAAIIPAWTAAFTFLYWLLGGRGAPESAAALPGMWWVELLRRLPILLLTYLVILLNLVALDYLLKPFGRERFMQAVGRARRQIGDADVRRRLDALVGGPPERPRYSTRLAVKAGGRTVIVLTDEIDWVGASDNYLELHAGANSYLVRETLGQLQSKLDPQKFVRIHRSTLVNVERVRELHP
ncbi:MAG TPA: LytTR family DNA-binding domain-containing protein, partial [Pyrinomonadaceae bacterium]